MIAGVKHTLILLATSMCAMGEAEPVTVITRNDGTAEKLKIGQQVAFAGMIYVGQHGTWIGNYMPAVPDPGTKVGPNVDGEFICADLLIPHTENHRLFKLEKKPVVATGTVAWVGANPEKCRLSLMNVVVRLR